MASLFDCVSPKSRRIKRKQKQAKALNNGVGVNPAADSDDSDDAYTASPKLQDKHTAAKQVQEAGAQDATSADAGANSRQQQHQQQLQSNTVSSTTPSEQSTTTVRQETQQLAVTAVNNDANRTESGVEHSANRNDAPQTVNDDVVMAATRDVIIEVEAYKVKSMGSCLTTAVANDDRSLHEARNDAAAAPPASNGDVLTANGREARVSGADASPQRAATGVRDPVSAVFMNQVSTSPGSAAAADRPAYRTPGLVLVAVCQGRANEH